ncbi:MAG: Ig-like domain-containing protein, partial [Patescibacteria group bacterium]
MSKKIIKFFKKTFVVGVGLATVLSSAGPFLLWPSIAEAVADTVAPSLDHWGVMQFDGDAVASTTAYVFTFAADNVAVPGTNLIVDAFYQNAGWTGWGQSVCAPQYTDSNLYKCAIGLSPSATEGRSLKYYLRAFDGTNYKFGSFATDLTATSSSQTAPIAASIHNTPPWTNTIAGAYTTSTIAWTGTKDGRCTSLALGAASATSSIYVSESAARANGLGMTPSDWILLGNIEKFQILATSTLDSYLRVDLSGYIDSTYPAGTCVNEFISDATVWISGTAISATSSDVNATSTFGNFTLSNVPDGTLDIVAYKKNYCNGQQGGNSVAGGVSMPISFMMPYGNCMGGGDMTNLNVIFTAPGPGATSAPIDIGLSGFPMIVGFSKNASSTTLTPSNILLKRAQPDGSMALVSSYYAVAYEAAGQGVTIGGNAYDFGPGANAIIYSTTTLATSSSYVVRLTSDIKDDSGNSLIGNDPQGGHGFSFSTGGFFDAGMMTTANFGQGGGFMPPFVMNASPGMGKMGVPTSTKIIIEFDQPMTTNSTVLSQNVQLWQLNSSFAEVSQISITASVSQTQPKILTIAPDSNLSASTRYRIKIKGGMQSSSGVTMAPPGSSSGTMFTAEFETGAAATAITLAVVGSNLDRYKNTAGSIVAVPTGTSVKVSFSAALDPTTVNTNTAYLRVKGSTTNITASTQYDLMGGKIVFIPDSALNATTTYVLYLTAGIKDFTSTANTLAATTIEFTTGGADVEAPKLQFFNSDDYSVSITFSKSMNTAPVTNTNQWPSGRSKWATSVLNPANYVFYVDNGPPPSGSTAKYFGCNNLAGTTTECNTSGTANLNFAYDTLNSSVKITGMKMRDPGVGLSLPGGVRVWVNNATDISGNVISDSNGKTPPNEFGLNSMGGPLMNSNSTFGMMGPGGGMMGAPTIAG